MACDPVTHEWILSWCLFLITSIQFAVGVYDQLMEAGREFGVKNAGMYAVDSLRIEKGYRHWGHELDTETTPLEARLSFAVKMDKVHLLYMREAAHACS